MDPVLALRQIAYYKDRAREDPRRVMAYRNAADIVEDLPAAPALGRQRPRATASPGPSIPDTAGPAARVGADPTRFASVRPDL